MTEPVVVKPVVVKPAPPTKRKTVTGCRFILAGPTVRRVGLPPGVACQIDRVDRMDRGDQTEEPSTCDAAAQTDFQTTAETQTVPPSRVDARIQTDAAPTQDAATGTSSMSTTACQTDEIPRTTTTSQTPQEEEEEPEVIEINDDSDDGPKKKKPKAETDDDTESSPSVIVLDESEEESPPRPAYVPKPQTGRSPSSPIDVTTDEPPRRRVPLWTQSPFRTQGPAEVLDDDQRQRHNEQERLLNASRLRFMQRCHSAPPPPHWRSADPYVVLGVNPRADFATCRKAWRKLALQYHPDKCRDPNARDAFDCITKAFNSLSDRLSR